MPDNTSSTGAPTLVDLISNVVDYKKLEVMDFLRSGAMLAVFLVLMCRGSVSGRGSRFAVGDVVGMAMVGLACYFFPGAYLGYQVDGKLDIVHEYVSQIIGAVLVGIAYGRYRSLETRDAYCSLSFSVTRLLGSAVLLMLMLQAQYGMTGPKKMSQQHFSFAIFGCCIWFVSHAIQLYHYTPEGKRAYGTLGGNRRDVHLLIGALTIITATMFHWTFPETTIKMIVALKGFAPDAIHIHVVRLLQGVTFIAGLQFLAALTYETDSDKKNTLLGGLVTMGLVFPVALLYQLKHGLYNHPIIMLTVLGLQTVNLLMGYCDGNCCANWSSCCFGMFQSKSKSKSR